MMGRWIAVLVPAFLVLAPDAAHACAVCFDPDDESRYAFLATTAFLTLLPLGMVGGAGLWIRRRLRAMAGEDDANCGAEE